MVWSHTSHDLAGASPVTQTIFMASKIREKRLAASKRYYEAHKNEEIQRCVKKKREYRVRNKSYVESYFSQHPCVDCGESDIDLLDFDHVRGEKLANVSDLVFKAVSINKLQLEIDKCDVRCSNCHRKITKLRSREAAISAPS